MMNRQPVKYTKKGMNKELNGKELVVYEHCRDSQTL